MIIPTLRKWQCVLLTLTYLATACSSHAATTPTSTVAQSASGALTITAVSSAQTVASRRAEMGAYARLETTFSIPDLKTDPFDYEQTDVRVQVRRVGGATVSMPAFFDGGTTWRARLAPLSAGRYAVSAITLNNRVLEVAASPRQWNVASVPRANFIRLDAKDKTRFVYSDGTPYFPLGHDQAWQSGGLPDIPVLFDKMGANGENWSRVWMNHWDNKNLDWPKPVGAFGTLNLDVAQRWDAIVTAAERNHIAFQMTLQHHGQYSASTDANWNDNPYNVKNGGFLNTPQEFFTNAQAKTLTRRKLRYIVARWGYSPAILSWELFNEVQNTDAAHDKQWDAIAQWHREMAQFLRAQDVYHHLITTSSMESIPSQVADTVDYDQVHVYSPDLILTLQSAANPSVKPSFVGEFGPSFLKDAQGVFLHAGLWSGLMSGQSGAPQYWTWDVVEQNNLYGHFRAASLFLKQSDLASQKNLVRFVPTVVSGQTSDLVFSPGGGWGSATQSDFDLSAGNVPAGVGALPSFLQGANHRDMSPRPLTFRVNYPRAGRFSVVFDQVAKAGAHIKLAMDGKVVEQDYAPSSADYSAAPNQNSLALDVPQGTHTITLENSGTDWVTIHHFTLTDYAQALTGSALRNSLFIAAWIYHRANVYADRGKEGGTAAGTLTLPVLDAGRYQATWWDTMAGKALQSTTITMRPGASLTMAIPPVTRDVALFVRRISSSK